RDWSSDVCSSDLDAKTALPVSNRFVGVVEVVRSINSKDRALTPDNRHDRALQGPPCLIVNDSPVVASASGAGEDASRREDRYLSQKAFNRQTPSRSITKITGNEYVLPLSWLSIWYSTLRRRTARAIRCWRRWTEGGTVFRNRTQVVLSTA